MTALTKDKQTVHSEPDIISFPLAAQTKIYKGALVMCVKGTGYAVPAENTASGIILGIALEQVDEGNGDTAVKVIRLKKVEVILASVSVADIGKMAYVADDQTVTLTAGNVVAGRVVGVKSANTAWIDMTQLYADA